MMEFFIHERVWGLGCMIMTEFILVHLLCLRLNHRY